MNKKLAYDSLALDKGQIVEDSKCCLKVKSVIARAGVYQYEDGKALKSKLEMLKATRTARYAKLTVGDHPPTKIIMNQSEIHGGVEKPFYDRGKLRAVLSFDKYVLPEETINQIRDAVVNKTGLDNSIGFYYDADWTSGIDKNVNTDAEEQYDYIMRNIVIDHVVVITDNQNGRLRGRCKMPKCGIGADLIGVDVVEKRGDKWCVIHCHGTEAGTPIKCFDTKEEAEEMHRAIEAQKQASTTKPEVASPPELGKPKIKGGIKMDENTEIGVTTPEEFAACVKERMAMGMTQGEAETYCMAFTTGKDKPTPVDQPTQQEETGVTGAAQDEGSEGSKSTVEKTDLEKCIANQVDGGKTPEEAEEWCKAELAGEHEAVDSILAKSAKLLELKRQFDIENKRPHIS